MFMLLFYYPLERIKRYDRLECAANSITRATRNLFHSLSDSSDYFPRFVYCNSNAINIVTVIRGKEIIVVIIYEIAQVSF